MPGSNPVANDKLLFRGSAVCSQSVVEFNYVQNVKLGQV